MVIKSRQVVPLSCNFRGATNGEVFASALDLKLESFSLSEMRAGKDREREAIEIVGRKPELVVPPRYEINALSIRSLIYN